MDRTPSLFKHSFKNGHHVSFPGDVKVLAALDNSLSAAGKTMHSANPLCIQSN